MRKHIAKAKAASIRKTRKAIETYIHFVIWADAIVGILAVAFLMGGHYAIAAQAFAFVSASMASAVMGARIAQRLAPARKSARRSSK